MSEATKREKTGKYHVFSVVVILLSIALAFFKFTPSGARTVQSVKDLINSVRYLYSDVTPTVSKIPKNMTTFLPTSWTEVKTWAIAAGKLFITPSNIGAYFTKLLWIVLVVIVAAAVLALVGWIFVKILKAAYAKVDNEHNVNSVPLKIWLAITGVVWYIPKDFLKKHLVFIVKHKAYIWLFGVVWAWNLNLITIAVEFIAFIIYLIGSGDFLNIFAQIAKLLLDLKVVFITIPLGVLWLCYKRFDNKRREEGFIILEAEEAHNAEVLDRHEGNILITGKPRVGKTKLSTYLQKLCGKNYRRQAKKSSFDRKMQFPFFPWKVLEQSIIKMRKRVPQFDLTFIHSWIVFMKEQYETGEVNADVLEALQEIGYIGHDFIFDYDTSRYPMTYNDNVRFVPLWETIELYAQEFYIYTAPKPFNFGNYPMRIYTRWIDAGNYPLLDEYNNIFRATPEELERYSQFNHKYFADMGRLGKKKNENGPYNNNFEFGVIGIAEAGKEYGNQKTNQGLKMEGECNPINDLAILNMKMQGQGSTIGYYAYFKIVTDEQRRGSVQADALETMIECMVLRKEKAEIKLPRFEKEARLYEWSREKATAILDYMNVRHGKNTLFAHLVLCVYSLIHNHYVRVYNQFASEKLVVKFLDHSNGEQMEDSTMEEFYVANREISNVYDTAYFASVYESKRAQSNTGGNDQVPQYTSLKPEISDMRELGSHFYDKVLKYFNADDEEDEG